MKTEFNKSIQYLNTIKNNISNDQLKKQILSKIDKQILKNFNFETQKTKLATIEKIEEINSHPLDDDYQIAKVLHWDIVIKKNEFSLNEKIIFIVIDSVIPVTHWKEMLNSQDNLKSMHVRTLRLQGVYSQGLIFPLSLLPEEAQKLEEGTNVEHYLNITKYQKYVPSYLLKEIEGEFPNYLCAETDEVHGLSYPKLVEEVLKNPEITVTQKLDGRSCTIIIENKEIKYVCSHYHILKKSKRNMYWQAALKINLDDIDNDLYILQGELMGPSLSWNQLRLKNYEIFIFQIKHKNKFLNFKEMTEFCNKTLKCKHVPHVGNFDVAKEKINIDFLQKLSDDQCLPTGEPAEGIIVRPTSYFTGGNGRPLGFKIINRNYKDE
jgi:RNA ligase (TIGR02306 family)